MITSVVFGTYLLQAVVLKSSVYMISHKMSLILLTPLQIHPCYISQVELHLHPAVFGQLLHYTEV